MDDNGDQKLAQKQRRRTKLFKETGFVYGLTAMSFILFLIFPTSWGGETNKGIVYGMTTLPIANTIRFILIWFFKVR